MKVEVELSLAAAYSLKGWSWVGSQERGAIASALAANADVDEYIIVELDTIEAEFIAADTNHEFVHGDYDGSTAQFMEEVLFALDDALGR